MCVRLRVILPLHSSLIVKRDIITSTIVFALIVLIVAIVVSVLLSLRKEPKRRPLINECSVSIVCHKHATPYFYKPNKA